jgi:hypothetical protein
MALIVGSGYSADLTFNIHAVSAWDDPLPAPNPTLGYTYADVWTDGSYAYVGSDRDNYGIAIFGLDNLSNPVYLGSYDGTQMEDVEVWNGYGYFGSDVSTSSGTGVDIVDLGDPGNPEFRSRVNGNLGCGPGGCGHNKVHTLSYSEGYLYTADNATETIKIIDVSNPLDPEVVVSLPINAPGSLGSHEVVVRNDRLYIASKTSSAGHVHIYNVSNPTSPVLLDDFPTGAASHTATPNADGSLVVVAEERANGEVRIYDTSTLGGPTNPDRVGTINRADFGIDGITPHHPHVYGNLLFVTWYEAGLQVFNITDPANPIHVGAFDTFSGGPPEGPGTTCTSSNRNCSGNWGVDVTLGLDTVLLSDRQRGLIVVDASGVLAPGDYDTDNLVDDDDYLEWRQVFGQGAATGQHTLLFPDGNYDDDVDAADYVVWRKFHGQSGPTSPPAGSVTAGSTVPEPATALLMAIGIGLVFTRRAVRRLPGS